MNYANLDDLSATSRAMCRGAWSLRRENSLYTGPTVRVRRSTDNVQQDFWADGVGRLWSSSNFTGSQVSAWSSNASLFCTTLYDQSTFGNHATQTTTTLQPILTSYTMSNAPVPTFYIDTRTGRYFSLPNGTIPAGTLSVVARHGAIDNSNNGTLIGGGGTSTNTGYLLTRFGSNYYSSFWGNDISYSKYVEGGVAAETYDATSGTSRLYVNGDLDLTHTRTGKNTTTTNHRLGSSQNNNHLNGDLLFACIFSGVITESEVDILSLRYKSGNVMRVPSLESYVGSASNLGNTELLLCSRSNTSGKYVFQSDIAPNFTCYFDAKVPVWNSNSFRFGIHSTLQSFYYSFPASNQMRMLDMNGSNLQSWTLNNSNMLSNGAWNSFKLINSDSNMIMSVNGRAYPGLLPNHPTALRNWRNGCFSFEASNALTQTGSNSVRRYYTQSITRFSDPIVVKDSLVSTVVNAAKIGSTQVTSRTVDANVIFSDWIFGSNIFSTSNLRCSNISASNLGTAAFCNVIPFSMVSGFPANGGSNFATLTATSIINQTLSTSNVLVGNGVIEPYTTISSLQNNLNFLDENVIILGKNTSNNNAAKITYMHQYDGGTTNKLFLGFKGAEYCMVVTTAGLVGINVLTPTADFDVDGTARIRSSLQCDGGATLQSVTSSNVSASNVTAPIFTASNVAASNVTATSYTASNVTASNVTCTTLNASTFNAASQTFSGNMTVSGSLTVNNRNMALYGGTGSTPTTFALNSTSLANTTSILQFVNASHRITCTDTTPFDGMNAVAGGHNIFYKSVAHNFGGLVTAYNGLRVGQDSTVANKVYYGSSNIGTSSPSSVVTISVTLPLGGAGVNYSVFPSVYQTGTVQDFFGVKWQNATTSGTNNTFNISVYRTEGSANGWANGVTLHWMVVSF